ncbi:MAG: polysaccharide biosynthesis protein [Lachnospiraceae bacterium]|nr:polysaccharide biosynthesis protein [Lachnospiraceae bacterium]
MTEQNKKTNNILVQGSILAAASLIVRFIGMLYRIPMTAILGEKAIGYYNIAFEFYDIALLLSTYSLPLAVSKLVSARAVQGQHKNARRVFLIALGFGLVVGNIAMFACYFGADIYARAIDQKGVILPLKVLAPTILIFSVMGVIRGYFQGYGNMVPTAISQIIEQVVNAGVSVGASYFLLRHYVGDPDRLSYGAAGGTLGTFSGALASFISLIIIYEIFHKMFGKLIDMEKQAEADGAESVKERPLHVLHLIILTVIPVVVSQTVYQLSGTVDTLVFNRVLRAKGFDDSIRATWWGIYSGKYKLLTTVPVAVASAMGTAIVPGLIAEYVRGHRDAMREKVAVAVKFNMIIAFPCMVGMSVLSGPILRTLRFWTDMNTLARNMLQLGSVSIVLFAFSTLTNGILQGINRLYVPVVHSAIALIVHAAVLGFLLDHTELNAYALMICNVLFAFIVSVLNWRSVAKYLDYKQEIRKTFLLPLIASVFMGISTRCLYDFLHMASLSASVSCVISILFAIPVYFAVLLILKAVTKEEILRMPKGTMIVKVLTKFKLLR